MNDKRGRGLSGATLLVCVILLFAALWFTNQIDQRDKQITYQDALARTGMCRQDGWR